jgi:Uri superfamily endonuclease
LSRGVYTLLIKLGEGQSIKPRPELRWNLPKGYYVYTGSALGRGSTSLEKRLERHLRVNKKIFWHIDRLLSGSGRIVKVFYAETAAKIECELNQKISSLLQAKPIKRFGSSDCRKGCVGHLLRLSPYTQDVNELVCRAYRELGLNYRELSVGLEVE